MGSRVKTSMAILMAIFMIASAIIVIQPVGAEGTMDAEITGEALTNEITPPSRTTYNGATYYVGGTGPGNHSTIQAAVDLCSDGDKVVVFSGTYQEEVVVDKEIWIRGGAGATLRPPMLPITTGFDLDASNVTITNFNITGFSYGIYSNYYGHNFTGNEFYLNIRDVYIYISLTDYHYDIATEGFVFSDNIVTRSSPSDSVYIYAEIDYDYENATNTDLGDIILRNNMMSSSSTSGTLLYFEFSVTEKMAGTLTMGDVILAGNTLRGGRVSFDFYGYVAYLEDVDVDVGRMVLKENLFVNFRSYGIMLDYYDFQSLYGDTMVLMKDLVINDNELRSDSGLSNAIYISDYSYWQYFYHNSYLKTGNVTIEDNTIDVDYYGIYFFYSYLASHLNDMSRAITQNLYIRDNDILRSGHGIYLDVEDAYYMYDRSYSELGDMIITGNDIISTSDGIYVYYYYLGSFMHDNSTFVMGDLVIKNNIVRGSYGTLYNSGIEFYLYQLGYEMHDDSYTEMGDIQIDNNDIWGFYGVYWDNFEYIGSQMEQNSRLVVGDINISSNRIRGIRYGLYISEFYEVGYYMYDNANATIGDISFEMNHIWSEDHGIYWDYFEYVGNYMSGSSFLRIGDISISGNTVISDGEAIYLYYFDYVGYDLKDHATVILGSFLFNDNTIRTNDTGIYIYYFYEFGAYLHDNASVKMENIEICRNDINSYDEGIYVDYLEYFGYYLYNWSSFEMGSILFNNNTIISSNDYGFYLYEIYEFGYEMEERSSFRMHNIEICGNDIKSHYESIYIDYLYYFGCYMDGMSDYEMNDILINDNTLRSSNNEGLYIYELEEFGYDMTGSSKFRMGNIEICRNDIISDDYGIHIYYIEYFGLYMEEGSSFRMNDILICDNTIVSNGTGLYIYEIYELGYDLEDNASAVFGNIHVDGNDITSLAEGIYVQYFEYLGESNKGDSVFMFGNITFNDNVIVSGYEGVYIGEYYYMLYSFSDDAKGNIGWLQMNNNQIKSGGPGLVIEDFDNFAGNNRGDSIVKAEGIQIINNTIVADDVAISMEGGNNFGHRMNGNARATMGPWLIHDNIIGSSSYGIKIEQSDMGRMMYSGDSVMEGVFITDNIFNTANGIDISFSSSMEAYANVSIGEILIDNNQFLRMTDFEAVYMGITTTVAEDASFIIGKTMISNTEQIGSNNSVIHLSHVETETGNGVSNLGPVTITGNNITGGGTGIELVNVGMVNAYVNNFIANMDDVTASSSLISWVSPEPMWYRYGMKNFSSYLGNYWDSYSGPDNNNDGIGDNPYNTGYGLDNKPLMLRTWELLPPWNDVTPPEINITSPADGSFIPSNSVTMTWTVTDDLLGVKNQWIRSDDRPWVEIPSENSYTFTDLEEGIHTLWVRAIDFAGNQNETSIQITVDMTPPEIWIISPGNGSAFNSTFVDVEFNGTDALTGISSFMITVDSQEPVDVGLEREYTLINLSEGHHELKIEAYDGAGIMGSAEITIIIDLTDPNLDIIHPAEGMTVSSNRINATWSGDGGMSGIGGYWMALDGGNLTYLGTSESHMIEGLSPGDHSLKIVCHDGAGNHISMTSEFTVDTMSSVVDITYPADGSYLNKTSFDSRWNLNGMTQIIERVEYRIDSGNWSPATMSGVTLLDLAEGIHTLDVKVTDIMGATAAATSRFTIDTTKPALVGVSHAGTSAPVRGPVVITFTEDIYHANITLNGEPIEFEIDGSVITLSLDTLSAGTVYMFQIKAMDFAGNMFHAPISFTTASSGTISGRIVDEDGNPVKGARIVFDTGEEAVTDGNGEFSIAVSHGSRTATVYDKDGNIIGSFGVNVIGGEEVDSGEHTVEPRKSSEPFPWWILALLALLILLLVGIVLFVLRSKGREAEEEDFDDADDIWEDDEFDEDYEFDDDEEF